MVNPRIYGLRLKWVALVIVLLPGCGNNASKELVVKFQQYQQDFTQLRTMSKEDAPKKGCLVVGPERIGNYANVNGAWTDMRDRDSLVELSAALENIGLQHQRYSLYITKLAAISAEKVFSCNETSGPEFLVVMSSAGFCDRTIIWSTSVPSSKDVEAVRQSGGHLEVVPMGDGWHSEIRCT